MAGQRRRGGMAAGRAFALLREGQARTFPSLKVPLSAVRETEALPTTRSYTFLQAVGRWQGPWCHGGQQISSAATVQARQHPACHHPLPSLLAKDPASPLTNPACPRQARIVGLAGPGALAWPGWGGGALTGRCRWRCTAGCRCLACPSKAAHPCRSQGCPGRTGWRSCLP